MREVLLSSSATETRLIYAMHIHFFGAWLEEEELEAAPINIAIKLQARDPNEAIAVSKGRCRHPPGIVGGIEPVTLSRGPSGFALCLVQRVAGFCIGHLR